MERILLSANWLGRSTLSIPLLSILLLAPLTLADTDDSNQPDGETAPFQGGWTAWLDPVTGKLSTEKPPAGEVIPLDDQTMHHFSTSEIDLIPETMPDGTVILNLRGRFHQGSAATIDNNGEVSIHRIGDEIFASPDGSEIRRRLHEDSNRSDEGEP